MGTLWGFSEEYSRTNTKNGGQSSSDLQNNPEVTIHPKKQPLLSLFNTQKHQLDKNPLNGSSFAKQMHFN